LTPAGSEQTGSGRPNLQYSVAWLPDEMIQLYRGLFVQEMAGWPPEVREQLVDYHVSPRGLKVGFQQASNVEQLYAEIRAAGPLPDVPLLILSSTKVDPFKAVTSQGIPESLLHEEIEAKFRALH
jgi:hypothetical protein